MLGSKTVLIQCSALVSPHTRVLSGHPQRCLPCVPKHGPFVLPLWQPPACQVLAKVSEDGSPTLTLPCALHRELPSLMLGPPGNLEEGPYPEDGRTAMCALYSSLDHAPCRNAEIPSLSWGHKPSTRAKLRKWTFLPPFLYLCIQVFEMLICNLRLDMNKVN